MDPLKRKCFAGSLAVHGSLLLVVIFGSAFLSTRHEQTEEVITTFTMVNITDGPTRTMKPAIEPPAPADPIPGPPAEPVSKPPAEPVSNPRKTEPDPEPPHVREPVVHHPKPPRHTEKKAEPKEESTEEEPRKEKAKDSPPETENGTEPKHADKKSKADAKPSHTKARPHHTTDVDLSRKVERRVTPTEDTASEAAEANAAAERAERQRRSALAGSLRSAATTIGTQGSTSTTIAMPGDLGPEFANYNHLIFSKYKLRYDQAVLKAGEFAAEALSVQVSITISRDGRVMEKKLTSPSGNRALDRLVRQVLDEVKSVAPFPPETHDTERTFEIIFNLKPNRQI